MSTTFLVSPRRVAIAPLGVGILRILAGRVPSDPRWKRVVVPGPAFRRSRHEHVRSSFVRRIQELLRVCRRRSRGKATSIRRDTSAAGRFDQLASGRFNRLGGRQLRSDFRVQADKFDAIDRPR